MGGRSAERDVSLVTGEQVASALEAKGYAVQRLDLDEGLLGTLQDGSIDCVFVALHGRLGEDGTVQGMLEVLGVPYTGSGVLASALAMDKVVTKKILCYEEIPTPRFWVARHGETDVRAIAAELPLPLVVKPVREGSAIGVNIVRRADELAAAVAEAFTCDDEALIEEYVAGTEITVGVLERHEPEALPSVEIVPANEMYDYDAKYTPGKSEHIIPARITEAAGKRSSELAIRAHRALGCRGFSRVDLIVTPEGEPYVLEVNTIPGMTGTSLFPEAAKAAGVDFPDLIEQLVLQALDAKNPARA
jgi:D-alanine-D-alanine ligase